MNDPLAAVIEKCNRALEEPDPQAATREILLESTRDPAVADAIAKRTQFASLADLAIHRSDRLTVLAGALPPGFSASPHNHNLWSVVGVCGGQEDNEFFELDGHRLKKIGATSVVAPGVLKRRRSERLTRLARPGPNAVPAVPSGSGLVQNRKPWPIRLFTPRESIGRTVFVEPAFASESAS